MLLPSKGRLHLQGGYLTIREQQDEACPGGAKHAHQVVGVDSHVEVEERVVELGLGIDTTVVDGLLDAGVQPLDLYIAQCSTQTLS